MRLFGNIYGGEVALGVLTALTIGVLPVALYGLEVMLTFVQALIFSTLTLMFIIAAIESHHHEEGEMGHEAVRRADDAPGQTTRSPAPPTEGVAHTSAQQLRAPPGQQEVVTHGYPRRRSRCVRCAWPGLAIGILGGMSAAAIGRNPDAAAQIRGLAIILAAFAEGLGVLAVVVGLLTLFIK